MSFLTDDPPHWIATCASQRDDVTKYLAKDFVPDPSKRYRWYFSGSAEGEPLCVEYDVLSETRCFEIVGFKGPLIPSDKNLPKKVCKSAIKKFAHRSPVAALYSLMYRQRKIAQYRKCEMDRAKARGDAAQKALVGIAHNFSGLRPDIPEYKKEG